MRPVRIDASSRFDHINEPHIVILPAGVLPAMDRKRVLARPQRLRDPSVERRQIVGSRVALEIRDRLAVHIDLGVFVMVDEQLQVVRFEARRHVERAAKPDVAVLPRRANNTAGSARLAKTPATLPGGSLKSGAAQTSAGLSVVYATRLRFPETWD